jgi:hypothetical protein
MYRLPVSHAQTIENICLNPCRSIGGEASDIIYQWAGICTDSEYFIYVTDAMDFSLKKLDATGKIIVKCGNHGQGPGEFMAPRWITCHDSQLYALDQYSPGIQIFNTKLEYISHIPFTGPIQDFHVIHQDTIVIAPLLIKDPGELFFLGTEGAVQKRIRYASPSGNPFLYTVRFIFRKNRSFVLIYQFIDKIQCIDCSGHTIWEKTLFKGVTAKSTEINGFNVPDEIVYTDIAEDSQGNIYILGGSYSENPKRDIYILNSLGEHTGIFTLSEPSHCLHIGDEDFLYTRSDMGMGIHIYNLNRENRNIR